jgi:hypothetical protein
MSKSLALAFLSTYNSEGALAVIDSVNSGGSITVSSKTGASGSLGYLLSYGDRASQRDHSARVYYGFLASGNYRPVLMDIVEAMVPKANKDWILASIPTGGRISKESLVGILRQVKTVYDNKRTKDGLPVELKGKKADYMAFINRVLEQAEPATIDA